MSIHVIAPTSSPEIPVAVRVAGGGRGGELVAVAPGGVAEVSAAHVAATVDGGSLLNHPDFEEVAIPSVFAAAGLCIAVTAILSGTYRRVAKAKQYEQSRREIAAYVAEGSIDPADAERLLRARPAGNDDDDRVSRACPRC